MTIRINNQGVAVDHSYTYLPMHMCPKHTTVQLLGAGGCQTRGAWDGKNPFWIGWAPMPKIDKAILCGEKSVDVAVAEEVKLPYLG